MAGSGTFRTVISENAMKGASQSALTKALDNANTEAIKIEKSGMKKK